MNCRNKIILPSTLRLFALFMAKLWTNTQACCVICLETSHVNEMPWEGSCCWTLLLKFTLIGDTLRAEADL